MNQCHGATLMQKEQRDLFQSVLSNAKNKLGDKRVSLNVQVPERLAYYLRSLDASPTRIVVMLLTQFLEANGVNLKRPHDREHWGEIEGDVSGTRDPLTWGEARKRGIAGETEEHLQPSSDSDEVRA